MVNGIAFTSAINADRRMRKPIQITGPRFPKMLHVFCISAGPKKLFHRPRTLIRQPCHHPWHNIMCVISHRILSDLRMVSVLILINHLKCWCPIFYGKVDTHYCGLERRPRVEKKKEFFT